MGPDTLLSMALLFGVVPRLGSPVLRWREVMAYQNLLIDVAKNSDWRFMSVCRENVRSSSSLLLEEVEKFYSN